MPETRTARFKPERDIPASANVAQRHQILALLAERDTLIIAANSARVLIERHRATRGGSQLLSTALQELDDVLPTYAPGTQDAA